MTPRPGIGNRLAPVRFLMFLGVLAAAAAVLSPPLGLRHGLLGGFDIAAIAFLAALRPLYAGASAADMRRHAVRNDANRALMLAITVAVVLVILVAVGSELMEKGALHASSIALIVASLFLAWAFGNTVYALHYAHLFYLQGEGDGSPTDRRGLDFPQTDEPLYWDFTYFSFTLGMTFQTSDVSITATPMRVVVIFHSLAAFVFNLGVVAFTVNVLGGG